MGTLLPLMCLLIGTGVIGPEIDDGSIVYLLAKPLPRRSILFAKLASALAAMLVFAVLPVMASAADRRGRGSEADRGLRPRGAARRHRVHDGVRGALGADPQRGDHRPAVRPAVGDRARRVRAGHPGGVSVRQWALAPAEAPARRQRQGVGRGVGRRRCRSGSRCSRCSWSARRGSPSGSCRRCGWSRRTDGRAERATGSARHIHTPRRPALPRGADLPTVGAALRRGLAYLALLGIVPASSRYPTSTG